MNEYLKSTESTESTESIKSVESIEEAVAGLYNQKLPKSTVILDVETDIPSMTYVEKPTYGKSISQDTISYTATKKVIVRTYKLRK